MNTKVNKSNRFVRFWMVATYPGNEFVSVRGFCEETGDRYEITRQDCQWALFVTVEHITDDSWGFRQIGSPGDLFSLMAVAEMDAVETIENGAWSPDE